MKFLLKLFFKKAEKADKPKKQKKSLYEVLLDKLMSIPLKALEKKWYNDLWKPDF